MKMDFCGPNGSHYSVDEGLLSNECFVDGLTIVPHSLFVTLAIPVLIILGKSHDAGHRCTTSWIHFQGHAARWILTICLIVFNILEIAEGLVSDGKFAGLRLHVYLPHCISVVAAVIAIVYYHKIEAWNSPTFLLLLVFYWLTALVTKSMEVASLFKKGLNVAELRFDLQWDVIIVYFLLICVELYVLFTQKYVCFKEKCHLSPPEELHQTKYYYSYASFLSQCTFWWMNCLLSKGYKKPLELKDLGKLPEAEWTVTNYRKLNGVFQSEKMKSDSEEKKRISLILCYGRVAWPMLCLSGIYRLIGDLLQFAAPLCISGIVTYVTVESHKTSTLRDGNTQNNSAASDSVEDLGLQHNQYVSLADFLTNGYVLALLLFIASLLMSTFLQNSHFLLIREGARIKVALQAMIYKKTLQLSSWPINNGQITSGHISNYMSNDVSIICMAFSLFHHVWAMPLLVILCLVLLHGQMGYSAVIGGLVVFILTPIQYKVASYAAFINQDIMQCSDARLKRISELFQTIKLIKLYAWELTFCQQVEDTRKREIKFLLKACLFKTIAFFITNAGPVILTLVTFLLYPYIEDAPLTAAKAFSALALFNMISSPLYMFPLVVNVLVKAKISSKRIQEFLFAAEVDADISPIVSLQDSESNGSLKSKVPKASNNQEGVLQVASQRHENTELTDKEPGPEQVKIVSSKRPVSKNHELHAEFRKNKKKKKSSQATQPDYKKNTKQSAETKKLLKKESSDGKVDGNVHFELETLQIPQPRSRETSPGEEQDCLENHPVVLEIDNADFSWDLDKKSLTLNNISIKFLAGQLTLIVGPVGCGKSSTLSAMLGEMCLVKGNVCWNQNVSIAYVSQSPWLLNCSLRDNILFGHPFEKKRYQHVLKMCALQPDLETLPAGDESEIGESGTNLSGGQKQRVSIARAIYSGADVIIMDDPLSALDANVGKQVFKDGLLKYLIKKKRKTVIMVTNHLQYLGHASQVVVMKEGAVEHIGTFHEIQEKDAGLFESWKETVKKTRSEDESVTDDSAIPVDEHRFVGKPHHQPNQADPSQPVSTSHSSGIDMLGAYVNMPNMGAIDEGLDDASKRVSGSTSSLEWGPLAELCVEEDKNVKEPLVQKQGKLIAEEERETGSIKGKTYLAFFGACTWGLSFLVLLLKIVQQGLRLATDLWLAEWSVASDQRSQSPVPTNSAQDGVLEYEASVVPTVLVLHNGNHSNVGSSAGEMDKETLYYVTVYAVLSAVSIIVVLFASLTVELTILYAARRLHQSMLMNLILAPLRFFDTTPIGRIISRFATDTYQLDQIISFYISNVLTQVLTCIAAIVAISMATPYFLIAVVPMFLIYCLIQQFFRVSARELMRLDNLSKSPIFAHFSESMGGLATIRAFRHQKRFWCHLAEKIDINNSAFLWLQSANRWLGIRLDFLGSVTIFIAAVAAQAAGLAGNADPGIVGLAIAYAVMISNVLNLLLSSTADLEMQMNAVERVDQYSHVTSESYTEPQGSPKLPDNWPSNGEIQFNNVQLKYAENLEPVLRDINLHIHGGKKIGICGRTGSGKSSLVLGLFRMIQTCQGKILVDGEDIATIPLRKLRSSLSIIPQDPALFAGTIRFNLDPEGMKPDEELWNALEISQLKTAVANLDEGLDAKVSNSGDNFSIGQKQLFCLARAFLRQSKILVMDEATASVDMETEAAIHQVVNDVFMDSTVLIIAHRVSTILNCDSIIVLEEGKVVEQDTPSVLLSRDNSKFVSFVKVNTQK